MSGEPRAQRPDPANSPASARSAPWTSDPADPPDMLLASHARTTRREDPCRASACRVPAAGDDAARGRRSGAAPGVTLRRLSIRGAIRCRLTIARTLIPGRTLRHGYSRPFGSPRPGMQYGLHLPDRVRCGRLDLWPTAACRLIGHGEGTMPWTRVLDDSRIVVKANDGQVTLSGAKKYASHA